MPNPTWQVRGVDTVTRARIERAARLRGLTIAEYLDRLSRFHERMRYLESCGEAKIVARELEALGLETVIG